MDSMAGPLPRIAVKEWSHDDDAEFSSRASQADRCGAAAAAKGAEAAEAAQGRTAASGPQGLMIARRECGTTKTSEDGMATGTIKTIRDDKGFGFITPDAGAGQGDLFFHRSAVEQNGFDTLRVGERVEFTVEPDPRDPSRRRAVNVRPESDEEA
jgi:cold shock protein